MPYAVTCKKRKHNKKYEYSENNIIDRTGHTYLDYLAFIYKHPGIYVWQLDFLGAIKTDNKNILTFILPNLQFTLLDIINKPDSSKVVEFFDNLEQAIGTEAFMKSVAENLNLLINLPLKKPYFNQFNQIYYLQYNRKEEMKKLYHFFYDDLNIPCLIRKRDKIFNCLYANTEVT